MKLCRKSIQTLPLSAVFLGRMGGNTAFVPSILVSSCSRSAMASQGLDKNTFVSIAAKTTAASSYSTSATLFAEPSKMDQSFPTWRYDTYCKRMEWTDTIGIPLTIAQATTSDDLSSIDDADLVIIGVLAPAEKESNDGSDDDSADNDESKKSVESLILTGIANHIDEKFSGAISDLISENSKTFKNGAKVGSVTPTIRTVGATKQRYIVMGFGPSATKDGSIPDWTAAGFTIGKALASIATNEKKVSCIKVLVPGLVGTNSTIIKDLSTAFYENLYTDNRYRTGSNINKVCEDLKSIDLVVEGSGIADATAIETGKKIADGIFLCKDIVNAPHNVLNSISLAETAKRLADMSGGSLKCTILNKDECEKRGMGAFLGVARGSETEPQFIHITYTPASGVVTKKIGIVGKGLLFDTGGYNIKTSMMEMMKFDCGGSAAVLGAARTISLLQPENVECHFIVAACENMINGRAVVPSDILTASNGKTIENMNTDAEGRLTLADALVYADKEIDCEEIIELSTLTGACMVALGKSLSGIWTSNDKLADELQRISKITGDKSWRMPLETDYRELLKSTFADIKNVGGRYGGAITAALFLQEFVSSKKPFAHIDIAGPVWNDKKGATGYGVKLITGWVQGASITTSSSGSNET
jgi:leucyl aminopeptidase